MPSRPNRPPTIVDRLTSNRKVAMLRLEMRAGLIVLGVLLAVFVAYTHPTELVFPAAVAGLLFAWRRYPTHFARAHRWAAANRPAAYYLAAGVAMVLGWTVLRGLLWLMVLAALWLAWRGYLWSRVPKEPDPEELALGSIVGGEVQVLDHRPGEHLAFVYSTAAKDWDPATRRKLSDRMTTRWQCPVTVTWHHESRLVDVVPAAPIPDFVANTPGLARSRDSLPLAVGPGGQLVTWRLTGSNPHLLVVGPTGSGKTSTVMTALTQGILTGADVRAVDINRQLDYFADWPCVTEIATRVPEAEALIGRVVAEMERRLEAREDSPHLLLCVEEYAGFAGLATRRGSRAPAVDALAQIAMRGRRAGVHLILATQDPRIDSKSLPGGLRDQLGTRVGMGKLSASVAEMVGVTIEADLSHRGRGVAYVDELGELEVQGLYTPDPTRRDLPPADRAILDDLRAATDNGPPLGLRRNGVVDESAGRSVVDNGVDNGATREANGVSYDEATASHYRRGRPLAVSTAAITYSHDCPVCDAYRRDHQKRKRGAQRAREAAGSRTKRRGRDRQETFDAHAGMCGWCGQPIEGDDWEVDHVDGDRSNDDPDNLAPLHVACHREKTAEDREAR